MVMIDNFCQRHNWDINNLFYKGRSLTKGCRQRMYGHFYEGSSLQSLTIVYDRQKLQTTNPR